MFESQKKSTISIPPMPDNRVTAPLVQSYTVSPPVPDKENNLAAMRNRTVGEQIALENKAWGFPADVYPAHELAHQIAKMVGIQDYNSSFANELVVDPLGKMIDEMMLGRDLPEHLFGERYYTDKYNMYCNVEVCNRVLLCAVHEAEAVQQGEKNARTVAEIWKDMHYDKGALEKYAKEIYNVDIKQTGRLREKLTVSIPKGASYHYDPENEALCDLPEEKEGVYESFIPPSTDDLRAFFERTRPALEAIESYIKNDENIIYGREDYETALKKMPLSIIMDALGTEKLMVHQLGEGAKGEKVDVRQGAADLEKAKDWREHIEEKFVKERGVTR